MGEYTSELALVGALEARHWRSGAEGDGGRRGPCGDGKRVVLAGLRSEEALCRRAVSFALAVLLECVLDCDGLVHQELAIHRLHRRVGRFKVCVGDETVAL